MGVKSARDSYRKDEVIEILKRNVNLYKNEPEFVEYIVNLALYLIDQSYTLSGERSADLEGAMEEMMAARNAPPPEPPQSLGQPSTNTPKRKEKEEINEKSTGKFLSPAFNPVFRKPPPISMPDEEMDMTTSQMRALSKDEIRLSGPDGSGAQPFPPPTTYKPHELKDAQERPHTPAPEKEEPAAEAPPENVEPAQKRTRQLVSPAELTPMPPGGLGKEDKPKYSVDQKGQTRVYKVVRSYNSGKEDDVCPICGSQTFGANSCPSCGHMM